MKIIYNLFFCILFRVIFTQPSQPIIENQPASENNYSKERALNKLREYLKIDTSHPAPDYPSAVNFLRKYAQELGLEFQEYKCTPSDPSTAILTWRGINPSLPSIILNSHTDVVVVRPEVWTYPPFNATLSKDDQGREILIGRGSQDCKSQGIIYMESLRSLIQKYPQGPLRTVYVTFVPEEEIGGDRGMKCMANSNEFSSMFGEIGLVIDEGNFNEDERILAFYGERVRMGFKIKAEGNSGHGSRFLSNLATDKLAMFESKARLYRYQQLNKMEHSDLELGDVTTINLNLIQGGTALNVIPGMVEAWYDVRATPRTKKEDLEEMFYKWATVSNVTLTFYANERPHMTNLESNELWSALDKSAKEFGMPLTKSIMPGATDSRYLRDLDIPAISLMPVNNHPTLAHAVDEYIILDSFYKALDFYIYNLPKLFTLDE